MEISSVKEEKTRRKQQEEVEADVNNSTTSKGFKARPTKCNNDTPTHTPGQIGSSNKDQGTVGYLLP